MTFRARHLLGIEHLAPDEIRTVLDLAERYVDLNRRTIKRTDVLAGMTQINMFFENSTRTQASFELAGKRLGADVMTMSVAHSSVKKGETLIDTALTLNAMQPDLLVVRHPVLGRGQPAGVQGQLRRAERGRRAARAPDAGAARRADDPPRQGPHPAPDRRDLRRHRA